VAYWALSLVLIGFGFLASFSIGQPFLLIGLAMLLLGACRHRPLVFWPPMLAVIAYDIAYWAVAPLGCTWTTTSEGVGRTLGHTAGGHGRLNPTIRVGCPEFRGVSRLDFMPPSLVGAESRTRLG
jgi:hypothetical protein